MHERVGQRDQRYGEAPAINDRRGERKARRGHGQRRKADQPGDATQRKARRHFTYLPSRRFVPDINGTVTITIFSDQLGTELSVHSPPFNAESVYLPMARFESP